ncbi:MAG: amino acid adenylation domain-containing protein [Chloroflexota bacterium]
MDRDERLEGVAIIGMAGRFPQANTIEALWEHLKTGNELVKHFTDEELAEVEYKYNEIKDDPDYVKARGILDDIDLFDASFFGFSPREASLLDPQQRLWFECAWQALENAGVAPAKYDGSIGVFAGGGYINSYLLHNLCADRDYIEGLVRLRSLDAFSVIVANDKDFLPTRTSYIFNLTGPSVNVQTACSTSLVAVVQACQSLLNYESDICLAGGVSIQLPQERGYLAQEGGMDSLDGHCYVFDERANGTIFSHGVGSVVLKRVEDAVNDGDNILAVIKGAALNNDGFEKASYVAPSVDGQAEVIAMAQAMTGFDPETISYVEAHGTATPTGDPIEIAGLTKAFRLHTDANQFCAIGSVKSNMGHLDAACGIAGLIKTVLALQHKQIPPSINYQKPNPKIDFENSPFYVASELTDWNPEGVPRRAGVSSFGVGGTNAHVVLEEAPEIESGSESRSQQLLVVSAKTETALETATQNLAAHLSQHPKINLADVAYTLQTGRQDMKYRRFLVADTVTDSLEVLERRDSKRLITHNLKKEAGSVVFMFPGQGAQHVDMGRDLYETESVFRDVVDQCCEILNPLLNLDLRDILYPDAADADAASEQLKQTSVTQPALFVIEYALAQLWQSWGVQPQAMVGHSVGEYVAACLAGVFSLEDALSVLSTRAQLMQDQPAGSMLAIRVPIEEITPYLNDEIALAAHNSPNLSVVSGPTDAIDALDQTLAKKGITTRALHTSHAFHSAMMEPVMAPLMAKLNQVERQTPTIPFISSLTGTWITDGEATDPAYWASQARQAVQFSRSIQTLQETPHQVLLEVGPNKSLSTLALQHPNKEAAHTVVASLGHPKEQVSSTRTMLEALGRLWQVGVSPDWAGFYAEEQREKVFLPTYPFERKRFWVDPPKPSQNVQPEPQTMVDMQMQAFAQAQPVTYANDATQLTGIPYQYPTNYTYAEGNNSLEMPVAPTTPPVVETAQPSSNDQEQIMSGTSRKERINNRLGEIMYDLSGIEMDEFDASTTFLEMGMDSLFLTQVSTALQGEFGIKIKFRQLIEEVDTLDLLAGYFDEQLPADMFAEPEPAAVPEPAPVAPAPETAPAPAMPPTPQAMPAQPMVPMTPQPMPTMPTQMPMVNPALATPANASAAERVVQQQLQMMTQLMSQQLAMMGGQPAMPSMPVMPMPAMPQVAAPQPAAPAPAPTPQPAPAAKTPAPESKPASAKTADDVPEDEKKQFGAMARIQRRQKSEFTPQQQAILDILSEQYIARTIKSKEFTQDSRSYMSDPRAVTGFKPYLKEMIYPIVVDRSKGSKVWDLDGNEYVDFINGFGSNYLGYQPDFLMDAIKEQMDRGYEIGPQHPLAAEVAQLICEFTGMERVAFCNTGSEAVLGAMRQARTITGKKKIASFTGSYHGITGEVIVRGSGSVGIETIKEGGTGKPDLKKLKAFPAAPGIMPNEVENILVLDYGTDASLEILREIGHELAAIIVEPVQSRRPELQPREFLKELRVICDELDIPLIFDEIINGFRMAPGGAQEFFDIRADISTYGKVIGGGLPFAAIAGSTKYMDALDGGFWQYGDDSIPEVGVTYFAGTFVRHPLALAASKAILEYMKEQGPDLQKTLNTRVAKFADELNAHFKKVEAPIEITYCTSFMKCAVSEDVPHGGLLYYLLRHKGVHMYEGFPCFLTPSHSEEDVDQIIRAFKEGIHELQVAGFMPGKPDESLNDTLLVKPGSISAAVYADFKPGQQFPMTEAQKEIWIASHLNETATTSYNELFMLDLEGDLDLANFNEAVQIVTARHQALHVRFSETGEYQTTTRPAIIDLPLFDLTMMSDLEQQAKIKEVWEADARRPFDLANGPLIFAKLFKLSEEKHVFLSASHHIVFDGWSAGVYLEEIGMAYSSLCQGEPVDLPEAPFFSDYVALEMEEQASTDGEAQREYWRQEFATVPPVLDLPTDRTRPASKSFQGSSIHWEFKPAVYEGLKEVAKAEGATLYATLLAAYNVFLYRLSGQDDLVVGIPTAGQATSGLYGLIGHCVNILPVRSNCGSDMTFKQFLAATKTKLLDAQDNQAVTFGNILSNLKIERDPSRSPLVEVIFNLNREIPGEGIYGLESRIHEVPKRGINWDMFLNLDETENTIITDCDYNTDIWNEETMRRWMGYFETLLEAIVANPGQSLANLPILSEAQRNQLLVAWNDTDKAYPATHCVHDLIEQQANQTPDAVAVIGPNKTLTYQELEQQANQLAHHLQSLGVDSGSLVGILTERTSEMVIGMLAVLKLGAAYVPMDPAYPPHRLAHMIEDAELSVILTEQAVTEVLPSYRGERVYLDTDWDTIRQQSTEPVSMVSDADQVAYVIYTSGSTGLPKGVQIPHRALTNFLVSMQSEPGLTADDTLLSVTTLSFDISALEIYLPLITGAKVVIVSQEVTADGVALKKAISDYAPTVMQATPATWQMLLDSGWEGQANLKVLCGGEAISSSLAQTLLAQVGSLWNMYGPTETTIWSTVCELKPSDDLISIGRPIANTQLYILDQQLQPVPLGAAGELYIGGDGLAVGYLKRDELTNEKFIPHPFSTDPGKRIYNTGDLARYLPDGRVACLGRVDHQVKIRGVRIELGEIESILREHPTVRETVVIVREDTPGDKRLVSYIVPGEKPTVSELRRFVQERLPDYMTPTAFVLLEKLPLTPNGKVNRLALPKPDMGRPELESDFVAPETETEKQVTEIWQSVLQLEQVGMQDNFFDLGGHSLLAIQVINKVRDALDVALPLGSLFEVPTVEALTERIEAAKYVQSSEMKQAQTNGAEREEVIF